MTKKRKSKRLEKGSIRRAISNNVYAFQLCSRFQKGAVIHMGLYTAFGYGEWLFYSAFFMRFVIGALEKKESFGHIAIFLAVTVVVFASLSIYGDYLDGKVFPLANVRIGKSLYQKLFAKAQNVELSCYEDSEFYNRYTLAMDGAQEKLVQTVKNIFGIVIGIVAAAVAFITMYQIDPLAMAFVIFPIIGSFVFNRIISKLDYNRNKEIAPHKRKVDYVNRVMYLSDYAKEVRLTGVFSLMIRTYNEAIHGMVDVTKKYSVKGTIIHWLRVMFTFQFIFEGVLLYGAYRTIVSHTMSLAKLAVLSSVMVAATWILIGFADSLVSSFRNGLFVENLRSFMEYEEKLPEDGKGEDPGEVIHSIEFRDVSFSYKDKQIIDHLSFQLRGGQSYAMVGHNGAGKSTIIKLLLRLYDPSEGTILLNGKDIRTYEVRKYRALFATAFQDYQIFAMSILENVTMRREQPMDEARAIRALKMSGIYDELTRLPNGIRTILTKEFDEDGAVLSGGQFQKIVAARAFVQNTPIKIFDEPSSALDPIEEYQLFQNILEDSRERTMLFISHRLSSVQNADWVFLLEQGSILEQGTHKQLMRDNGVYADMYHKQAKNYLARDTYEEDSLFHVEGGMKA